MTCWMVLKWVLPTFCCFEGFSFTIASIEWDSPRTLAYKVLAVSLLVEKQLWRIRLPLNLAESLSRSQNR